MTQLNSSSSIPVELTPPDPKVLVLEKSEERRRRFILLASVTMLGVLIFCGLLSLFLAITLQESIFLWMMLLLFSMSLVSGGAWLVARRYSLDWAAWLIIGSVGLTVTLAYFVGFKLLITLVPFTMLAVLALVTVGIRAALGTLGFGLLLGLIGMFTNSLVYSNEVVGDVVPSLRLRWSEFIIYWFFQCLTLGLAIFVYNNLGKVNQIVSHQAQQLAQSLQEQEVKREVSEKASREVSAVTAQLHATANEQAVSSQEQAAAITQITSFVTELSHTAQAIAQKTGTLSHEVQEVSSSTGRVKVTAEKVIEAGESGAIAVERAIQSSDKVTMVYKRLKAILEDLERQQEQIREVVNIIRNISDETNLLALNAAIEAAGAGEFGERFGVVASEVKALANRSLVASREVNGILGYVEGRIQEAVVAAENAYDETQGTAVATQDSGMAMRDLAFITYQNSQEIEKIEQAINIMSEQTKEISQATSQQYNASNQVAVTLQEINNLALQTVASSSEVSKSASNLETLAQDLIITLAG